MELHHLVGEPHPNLPNDVLLWNRNVLEEYLSRITGPVTKFVQCSTPLASIGRQMRDLFLWTCPSLVLASKHIQSAWAPLVVHILPPLMTSSLPTTFDVVLMLATSEPDPTSLTPGQTAISCVGRHICTYVHMYYTSTVNAFVMLYTVCVVLCVCVRVCVGTVS